MPTNEIKLGQLIDDNDDSPDRDAVHIAVYKVQAGGLIYPGAALGFASNAEGAVIMVPHDSQAKLGVPDPFLDRIIHPGERFRMFLYPGSITSLRHVWTHPRIDHTEVVNSNRQAGQALHNIAHQEASREWIKRFAEDTIDISYEKLMEAATDALESASGIIYLGDNEPNMYPTDEQITAFWAHYSQATGRYVDFVNAPNGFRCAC